MAAGLRLGPLLRHVDHERGDSATVWMEADRPCTAEVRCADGAGGAVRTFQIAGHHYALVPVTGLAPGTTTAYEVLLDGVRVWPLPDSPFPPSTIRTPEPSAARPGRPAARPASLRVAFGSCRQACPPTEGRLPHGVDALNALAERVAADPGGEGRPDVVLLLGDQVYADHLSARTRQWLAARRDLSEPPGAQAADYEEYTRLYQESWLDPGTRWLLSTVPSLQMFDDHDIIDDWNTSAAWLDEIRAAPWWRERIISGLMAYWVHQHLGNLSPAELAVDKLYAAVRETPDGTEALRAFAAEADATPGAVRWSYRRDFGRTRLLMVDTRTRRVLAEDARAMLDPAEQQWLRDNALEGHGSYDHLLIGTSLPWLMPPLVHDAEGWNAALCRGVRGERWARFGENLRRRSDLEHWAAFPASFAALSDLVEEVGTGPRAPATVCVLSGDVHHAYVAEPRLPTTAGVFQLTSSPVHNSVHRTVRFGFRLGWSGTGRWLGRLLSRHGRTGRPPLSWRRTAGPWFGNQLMTLTLTGGRARLQLDQARREKRGRDRLVTVLDRELTGPSGGGHGSH
ncbi:alkaline phosphatase D family protein [Streptomyces antimicrobicus]|uniref:Alkaline phosphatase family protein n=1 Tax=Streptomyces antimicrobicus TaxID=2883108 RepID=A0ABS8B8V3_9ACTN|nr:alkaline phosphatase D family protein [Streptomyces antimicrobicus]MCB5180991.1 alkaline phosphatase family protein [Streptomyces antimicrobicus]